MYCKKKLVLIIICAVAFNFSLSFAEDLFVVRNTSKDINDIISLSGVNVYAFMQSALLIGTTEEGSKRLRENKAVVIVESIGVKEEDSDYFLFHFKGEDIGNLKPEIDIVCFNGSEAIARVDKGKEFDPSSITQVMGLTRISFIPMPLRKQKNTEFSRNMLTDPDIVAIVSQVSETEYTAYIQRLQDFVTRYSRSDSCRAAEQWAADTFSEMGLETDFIPYYYTGKNQYNVVGRQVGTVYPDSIYIIVAHMDATSHNPWQSAPGAEDNGSGSACVLEAARVLSQHRFDCTIEYVLVTGEEQGLLGSQAYANYCFNEGYNLAGVLNFDMISYAGSYGWDTNIYADQNFPAEMALADLLAQLTDDYTDAYSIREDTDGPVFGSDHYYFSFFGYPAPFSIDAQLWGAPDWYPWYHTTNDQISRLDLDFGTEVVKGGVAALAALANVSAPFILQFEYPNSVLSMIDPETGAAFRVDVNPGTSEPEPASGMLHYSTGGDYTSVPMDVLASNSYNAVFPPLDAGEVVSFYISAETDSNVVVTDPQNAPSITYIAYSAFDHSVIYEDDFSSNKGWSGLGGQAEWTIGVAVGGKGHDYTGVPDPTTDHSLSSDNQVLGNDLTVEDGDSDPNIDDTYWITSPIINCSGYVGVNLRFFRWLGVGGNNDDILVGLDNDKAYIQAYDGNNWTTIFTNGPLGTDDMIWREKTYDISSMADGNHDFRLRFGLGTTNGRLDFCGWNIDDLEITGYNYLEAAELSIDLIPDEDPTIVQQGESFGMTGIVTNNGGATARTDIWLGAYRGDQWFQQQLIRDITVQSGQTIESPFTQGVPLVAPPGDYTYVGYCGDYETRTVADSSYFPVTVIEAGP
jgi:hypothetical protein